MACSSAPKADIANNADPREEFSKLDTDLHIAVNKNIDVLAPNEFKDALKWQTEAKSDMATEQKQDEILEDLRKGRGSLEAAYAASQNRSEKAPSLFESRQFALKAGAGKFPELRDDLQSLDHEVGSQADRLISLDTKSISKLQGRYMDLETRAIILTQLSSAQSILNGSKKDGAGKIAPITFKKTEVSLNNAKSAIATNTRNPGGFQEAVATANADAALLGDVMTTLKGDETLQEGAALKILSQKHKISELNSNVSKANAETAAVTSDLDEKNKDLRSANADVEVQRVMENARTQFSAEEAEAYQQGPNLVIQLKQINFVSGRTELPTSSLAALAKVSSIAKVMHASEIKVQGHTDSIGSESQNQPLSEGRADAVAAYFKSNGFQNVKSEGFGFQKPLATNKTKEGRAQNRRVDIILTPENASTTN
jgi:outer membrane protein OmpA-like peptidoglycan-associated protein